MYFSNISWCKYVDLLTIIIMARVCASYSENCQSDSKFAPEICIYSLIKLAKTVVY